MKIIVAANETLLKILSKYIKQDEKNRMLQYCVEERTEDGVLLYNLLTKELVLLDEEEYSRVLEIDYLKQHWFVVPEMTKEKELSDLIKWMMSVQQKKTKEITNYTIFTTTDCNARCFYCFELGGSRIPMSNETALKVVDYIKAHSGSERVKISWFGGEPLYNHEVIDTICDGLRRNGIEFKSDMLSNGYLFDDEMVRKAVHDWNLKKVQISLDGTEAVYNKIKAYIYREKNAYQVVLENIGRLLDASIPVHIRLNMDLYNAEDLLSLVDELGERFSKRRGISIYAHHLFNYNEPSAYLHNEEEWNKRDEAMCRLNERIAEYGLTVKRRLGSKVKLNACKADHETAITILPDGTIGKCDERYGEGETVGHIDCEGFDQKVIESWKETVSEIPECETCFYYPACIKLKKCTNNSVCFFVDRKDKRRNMKNAMLNEYERWKNQDDPAVSGDADELDEQ